MDLGWFWEWFFIAWLYNFAIGIAIFLFVLGWFYVIRNKMS
jgi:hypothetical protein